MARGSSTTYGIPDGLWILAIVLLAGGAAAIGILSDAGAIFFDAFI